MNKPSYPYPADPKDWQNAYKENQAFTDSFKRTGYFFVPIAVLLVIPILFAIFSLAIKLDHAQAAAYSQTEQIYITIAGVFSIFAPIIILGAIVRRLFKAAEIFLGSFHNLPTCLRVKQIVNMRFYGCLPLPPPLSKIIKFRTVKVKDGKLSSEEDWATQIGGPIKLSIDSNNAVYLERGNRFSRVVGMGDAFLELHETVRTVLNTEPQIEEINVKAWTKDGIHITIKARGTYSLGSMEEEKGKEIDPFPVPLDSIRLAVERALKDGREGHEWIRSAVEITNDILIGYIMNKHLEELFISGTDGSRLLSTDTINDLLKSMNIELQQNGVCLSQLQITDVELPEQILKQIIKIWESERRNHEILALSEVKARELHDRKQVLAEILRDMVFTLANGIERTETANSKVNVKLLSSIYTVLNQGMKERGNRPDSQSRKGPDGSPLPPRITPHPSENI